MNVALFGGTFDPVHLGHLHVARAARERFRLHEVHFVPAAIPPHKAGQPITAFSHRYAMLALATAGDPAFLPSLLESPEQLAAGGVNYTIDTVHRFRRTLSPRDRLFFLIGMDAFRDLGHWHHASALLRAVEFIVVSRPGFLLEDIVGALPARLRAAFANGGAARPRPGAGKVHMLDGLAENVSATEIRQAATRGRQLDRFVGPEVAAYIRKQGLYREPARRPLRPVR
jgi:nicotinate-nucleotide adenylyltransferase